jgi:hypothetical protein
MHKANSTESANVLNASFLTQDPMTVDFSLFKRYFKCLVKRNIVHI